MEVNDIAAEMLVAWLCVTLHAATCADDGMPTDPEKIERLALVDKMLHHDKVSDWVLAHCPQPDSPEIIAIETDVTEALKEQRQRRVARDN